MQCFTTAMAHVYIVKAPIVTTLLLTSRRLVQKPQQYKQQLCRHLWEKRRRQRR